MNFTTLFFASRVIQSSYRGVLTLWLFYHLALRIARKESPRNGRRNFSGQSHRRDYED